MLYPKGVPSNIQALRGRLIVWLLQPGPPKQSWSLPSQEKKYIPRKLVVGQSAARKKHKTKQRQKIKILIANVFLESKKLHKTMFLYSKLYIYHPEDICSTHAVILLLTSNFFATIVPRYNKHATARQKYDERLQFCLHQYSNGLVRKHRLFPAGCN